jgi:hypothetical protein
MKKTGLLLAILLFSGIFRLYAAFDDYFLDKTLRIDYMHTGNDTFDLYSLDQLIEEKFWAGSKTNLIDPFDYGKYKAMVYDSTSNTLIYSFCYSTLFNEWQSTDEAKTNCRSFSETFVMPYPKNKIRIEFFSRDKKNIWHKKFEYKIDPKNYFISHENRKKSGFFKIVNNGESSKNVDIVIIPDGYTKDEFAKFKKDCKRFSDYLLNCSPYKEYSKSFNFWGIEAYSEESGTDIPGENIWKSTVANSGFYTFDSERYLMINDNKNLRDLAANVPYDQIFILVNTEKYGGGGIYNYYCTCAADNVYSDYVCSHEFSHAFAGLGDEYYTSDVSVVDFYPVTVEPWEPNLTTLVNFDTKWKKMVSKSIPIPTPVEDQYKKKVGVYEGGGYAAKGVYRPMIDCSMKSISYNNFCPVCRAAIVKMIEFYTK